MRSVVITGVGTVSPFGVGNEAFRVGLRRGCSAVRPIASFDTTSFPVKVAAEVPASCVDHDWVLSVLGDCEAAARLRADAFRDRKAAFAVLAAFEAWRDAGLDDRCRPRDASISFALGLEHAFLEDFAPIFSGGRIRWDRAPTKGMFFRARTDLGVDQIAEGLGLCGDRTTHVSACAAGTLALSHAARLIARGDAECVLSGGADSMINPLGLGGMARLQATSPRATVDACRPFDVDRDGLVMGEGAAAFLLESAESAAARGARAYATILGWGSSQDGFRISAPRPDGQAAAASMSAALRNARLEAGDIDAINAHGTGTRLNDPAEAIAIRQTFGSRAKTIPVSALKGAVGHTMAAAGAIEAAASIFAMQDGFLIGTTGLRRVAPECALAVVGPGPRPAAVNVTMSNSFGFGGQNATIILRRGPR